MRDAEGFAPAGFNTPVPAPRRVAPAVLVAAVLAAAAAVVVPRGLDAQHLLLNEADPSVLADRALATSFDSVRAASEIDTALAAKDIDLAQSVVDLAAARHVAIDDARKAKVAAAVEDSKSTRKIAESFALGFATGEPSDGASLAGTAVGDLMVFGDIRDAVREGTRLATGQQADELVLGLAGVGLAITAGTYATLGGATPARVGISLAKAARKTGQLSADLTSSLSRMMRGVVDWAALKRAIGGASVTEPQVAMRAAREAIKLERAGGLIDLARNAGRVQAKAGTRAALDGLKIAESPAEMARVAKLAEKEGSRTRAILKVAGRSAIALTMFAFDLGVWVLGAILSVLAFVSSLKSATERTTARYLFARKRRRMRRELALAAH